MQALTLNEKTLRLLGLMKPHLFGSWFPNIVAISIYLLFSCLLFWGCVQYVAIHADDLNKSASAIYVITAMSVSIGTHIAMSFKMQKFGQFFSNMKSVVTESMIQ